MADEISQIKRDFPPYGEKLGTIWLKSGAFNQNKGDFTHSGQNSALFG
ncbi:MAG: hypothetical protein IJ449_06055 [Clostridia bacterium]|nr:hypothetical protein [Clostridia bacterium]